MTMRIEAITATRGPIGDPTAQLEALLGQAGFAGAIIRRMANYPPQGPTYGARQSLGVRAGARTRKRTYVGRKGYRRTGTLGRNWRLLGVGRSGGYIISTVSNRTPYGVYVEGPEDGDKGRRQTAVMRDKGWPNITAASRAEWARWRPRVVRVLVTPPPGPRL